MTNIQQNFRAQLWPREGANWEAGGRRVGGAERRGKLGKDLPSRLCKGAPAAAANRSGSASSRGKGAEASRTEILEQLSRLAGCRFRGHRRSFALHLRPLLGSGCANRQQLQN